jgi:hypothetical protein
LTGSRAEPKDRGTAPRRRRQAAHWSIDSPAETAATDRGQRPSIGMRTPRSRATSRARS